jgi:DNA-binding NarL/FixJ family response regulator
MLGVTPFMPLDGQVQWDVSRALEVSKHYTAVFGTGSPYEAYLFVLLFNRVGASNLLGAGCNEKEVEDLVDSAQGPTLLFLVDGIAKDCGVSLVRRLRERHPTLKAMLLVNSQETYVKNPAVREVYDGVTSGGVVGRGGLICCAEAVIKGERYVDSLLEDVEGRSERSLWNDLNQREREIVPLLAKGMKNREIAAELFIAETTTRDYVSSILSKLQVSNRAAAAAWAIEQGFVGG